MAASNYLDGQDGRFHYLDWGGQGPRAHIAHATGLCAGAYTPLATKLTNIVALSGMDDRGHGRTSAVANPDTLRNWDIFVDDLDRYLSSFNEPIIAMGHSRGAVVSLLLALRHPDRIKALVLIDPTILPYIQMWLVYFLRWTGLTGFIPIAARAAKRNATWPDRKTILDAYRTRGMFKTWQSGFLESYIENGTQETRDGQIRLSCDPAWEARCFSAYPPDLWRYIPAVRQPVLVLYGGRSDTFIPRAAQQVKKRVPHAKMICFKNTSHFVPMEKPAQTAHEIHVFIAALMRDNIF